MGFEVHGILPLYHKSSPLCACSCKDYTLTFSLWPGALERQSTYEADKNKIKNEDRVAH